MILDYLKVTLIKRYVFNIFIHGLRQLVSQYNICLLGVFEMITILSYFSVGQNVDCEIQ